MIFVAEGYAVGISKTDKGAYRGNLIQGGYSMSWYTKSDSKAAIQLAEIVQNIDNETPTKVEISGLVMPGRDYESKQPDGRLSVRVDTVEVL